MYSLGWNIVAEWLALLLCIAEALGSNLGMEASYLDRFFCSFPQSLQANAVIVP
jgi:hypothetical protein